ncbi:MAG: protein kinase [Labilithrix sp.]
MSFEEALIGQRVGGKYVVDRILGRGGMGCVALGHHEELGQKVAIKFMLAEVAKDAGLVARFSREAQLAAKLQSEHVVRVFDVGRLDSGLPYLVMEYLEGAPLSDALAKGALTLETSVDHVLQALEAIAEAHALGVVHRDLKPENLFLARKAGKPPMVKVLDFGISKTVDTAPDQAKSALTQTSSMLGSPMYMSPEQIRDSKTVDTRSDLWSIGVVLYELAEGRPPFDGASVGELLGRIQYEAPAPMTASPAPFAEVVMRCLTRSPRDRFQSAADLARALRPFGSASGARSIAVIEQLLATAEPELALRGTVVSAPSPVNHDAPTRSEGRRPAPEPSTTAVPVSAAVTAPARPSMVPRFLAICAVLATGGVIAGAFALRARTTPAPATSMAAAPPPLPAEAPALPVPPAPLPVTVLLPAPSASVAAPVAVTAPVAPSPRPVASATKRPAAAASEAPALAEPDRGF